MLFWPPNSAQRQNLYQNKKAIPSDLFESARSAHFMSRKTGAGVQQSARGAKSQHLHLLRPVKCADLALNSNKSLGMVFSLGRDSTAHPNTTDRHYVQTVGLRKIPNFLLSGLHCPLQIHVHVMIENIGLVSRWQKNPRPFSQPYICTVAGK